MYALITPCLPTCCHVIQWKDIRGLNRDSAVVLVGLEDHHLHTHRTIWTTTSDKAVSQSLYYAHVHTFYTHTHTLAARSISFALMCTDCSGTSPPSACSPASTFETGSTMSFTSFRETEGEEEQSSILIIHCTCIYI